MPLITGKPSIIMVDKGSEWGEIKDALHMIQMTSIFNQVSYNCIKSWSGGVKALISQTCFYYGKAFH